VSLDDLYKEVILDHYKSPRNKRGLEEATASVHGNNPLCGDEVTVHLRLEDGRVAEAAFEGQGCSISQASASMMT
jgi:nitrogen fixation protein NifU and related proteins